MNTTHKDAHPRNALKNVTIKQIKAFLAAHQYKSFSHAASAVFQSQPAFSRCIQDLEFALGEELFTRSRQGVALSPFGIAFLPHAKELAAGFTKAQASVVNWHANQLTELTLAGCASVIHLALPTLMEGLHGLPTQCTVRLDAMSSAQVVRTVLAGEVAMGVCTLTDAQPELSTWGVLESPLGLLMATDFVLPQEIKTLADLDCLPFARFQDDAVVTQTLLSHGIHCDAYFNAKVTTCGVPGVFPLLRHGKNVVFATGFGASHPHASDLRFVPLPQLLPTVQVNIIRLQDGASQEDLTMHSLVRQSIHAVQWNECVKRL